ncbi:MAG: DUF4386 family protein [Caldilineaceae bacterium]|nr:DUF4386 family protein [Caldilineaceae bacterium]
MRASIVVPTMQPATETAGAEPGWRGLYTVGGAASLLLVVITLCQFALFIVWPPPLEGSAADWFTLFQRNRMLGLLSFELLLVAYALLSIPVALALYGALRRTSPSFSALYLALALVGAAAFVAARPALEMLALSNHYAAATGEAQRVAYLAAGEMLLATFDGTAFHVSYLLGSIQGLVIAWLMLHSPLFGKGIAYLRLASSVLDFGLYIPAIGLFLSMGSVVCLLVWNTLIAHRLLQLGQGVPPTSNARPAAHRR